MLELPGTSLQGGGKVGAEIGNVPVLKGMKIPSTFSKRASASKSLQDIAPPSSCLKPELTDCR